MARMSDGDLQKLLKKQAHDYGDFDDIDPDDYGKDTEEDLEEVVGEDDLDNTKPLDTPKLIEEDEEAIKEGADQQDDIVSLSDLDDDTDDEDL